MQSRGISSLETGCLDRKVPEVSFGPPPNVGSPGKHNQWVLIHPCGHPPRMGGPHLQGASSIFFSLFLFKGNGSHLSLRGSALQLWTTIQILLLEATCEGQPAMTRGPKGLKTNLGTGRDGGSWRKDLGMPGRGERCGDGITSVGDIYLGSQCLRGHRSQVPFDIGAQLS